jgi:hypothetical protein
MNKRDRTLDQRLRRTGEKERSAENESVGYCGIRSKGTSHALSSAILAFQAGIKQRAFFKHGAGDVEEAVADCAQSTRMATASSFQSKIRRFALFIASSGGISQVMDRIAQSWIASEPSGNGAAFARSAGDRGHPAQLA